MAIMKEPFVEKKRIERGIRHCSFFFHGKYEFVELPRAASKPNMARM